MGRHRRATPAAAAAANDHRGHRKRGRAPVRTGLLGASAAMAVGAVAVASGLIPGAGNGFSFKDSDGPGTRVQADATPEIDLHGPPPESREREEGDGKASSRDQSRSPSPTASASEDGRKTGGDAQRESPTASPDKSAQKSPDGSASKSAPAKPVEPSSPSKPSTPTKPPSKSPSPPGNSAEAQVVTLVNQERAKAGCQPVQSSAQLAGLARDHSKDMAARGYFSHTDPDGNTPWDRAEARGIANMGGENIARGQASAESVMTAWMDSPGHRANILNCDFKTLGVGGHFAEGGPWWTQAFGR